MKAIHRYTGEVTDLDPSKRFSEITILAVEKPNDILYSSFFKEHPGAFDQIATSANLDMSKWRLAEYNSYFGRESLKVYIHRSSTLRAYVNTKGMITDFISGDKIYFYSASEDKLYCMGDFCDYQAADLSKFENKEGTMILNDIKEIYERSKT